MATDKEGIGVLDETGFLKKGGLFDECAAVVQHNIAGKIENCQIGVFLSFVPSKGHVLLDRRLYLSEAWCADAERQARIKVPAEVAFQTKPELGMAVLDYV
ncbi:MAG: transposase [Anaerolineae bacterium]|nr:transposase [Anaerolineae bacterium]